MTGLTVTDIMDLIEGRLRAYSFAAVDEQATPVKRAEYTIRRRELLDLHAALEEEGRRLARPAPAPVFAFNASRVSIEAGVKDSLRVMRGETSDEWHRR